MVMEGFPGMNLFSSAEQNHDEFLCSLKVYKHLFLNTLGTCVYLAGLSVHDTSGCRVGQEEASGFPVRLQALSNPLTGAHAAALPSIRCPWAEVKRSPSGLGSGSSHLCVEETILWEMQLIISIQDMLQILGWFRLCPGQTPASQLGLGLTFDGLSSWQSVIIVPFLAASGTEASSHAGPGITITSLPQKNRFSASGRAHKMVGFVTCRCWASSIPFVRFIVSRNVWKSVEEKHVAIILPSGTMIICS